MIATDLVHQTARGRGQWAAALALATAVTLALAPSATAKPEPVSGGKTTLKIKSSVAEFLADTGTKVKAIDPAKDKKSGIKLPIKSGELDAKKPKGSLKHDGGIELKGDGGDAELTKLAAKFGKDSSLKATVDKKNTKLFDLDTDKAKTKDKDGKIVYSGIKAILTAKGVSLLEDVTDTELAGDAETVFGKLKVAAKPGDLVLESGDASLSLDSAFTGGGTSATAIAPATEDAGALTFPITGGEVGPDGDSGTVRTDGGLRLAQGGSGIELTELRINLANGEITAAVAGNRIAFASFEPGDAEVTVKENVRITGIRAELTADGASALNEAFGGTAFSAGQAFGEFEVKAIPEASGGGNDGGEG